MNRFLIPKILRQLLKVYIPLGMLYFLIFLFAMPHQAPETHILIISYDTAGIFWALILALFFAGHLVWVLFFPPSKSSEEIRFLSTLPVSRKRIARNDIKLFFYIHGCVISLILVIGLLLFLSALLTGMQLLFIIVACLWFTICTLLAHLISLALKNWFIRIGITILAFCLFIPLMVFLANPDYNAVAVLLFLILCSLILAALCLFIHWNNEEKFMYQDLL